jgi:uncharacterized membrane protein
MPKVEREITVQAPADAVYAVWHNFENFPRFMDNIEEVRVVSDGRSHWKAKAPLGSKAEWDAEMTLDDPAKAIGWRSIDGNSSVKTAGRVSFDDLGEQTRLRVTLQYDAPAGPIGNLVAKIFSNPERQIDEDLHRFKDTMERGWDASGIAETNGGTQYGSSMGGANDRDLQHINQHNDAATTPADIDDPAQR